MVGKNKPTILREPEKALKVAQSSTLGRVWICDPLKLMDYGWSEFRLDSETKEHIWKSLIGLSASNSQS